MRGAVGEARRVQGVQATGQQTAKGADGLPRQRPVPGHGLAQGRSRLVGVRLPGAVEVGAAAEERDQARVVRRPDGGGWAPAGAVEDLEGQRRAADRAGQVDPSGAALPQPAEQAVAADARRVGRSKRLHRPRPPSCVRPQRGALSTPAGLRSTSEGPPPPLPRTATVAAPRRVRARRYGYGPPCRPPVHRPRSWIGVSARGWPGAASGARPGSGSATRAPARRRGTVQR